MFELFRQNQFYIKGIVLPSQTDYIRRVYKERLDALRNYYQSKTFYIQNQHILVRLLHIGLGSLHTNHETFTWTAMDRANVLSRHFQFTSPVSYGKIWYGDFYGKGSYEIIIGDESEFDIDYVITNWKVISSVRVLTHPVSDFGLTLPNGKDNHYIDGLSVIYINIPMLMLQYRMFIENGMKSTREQRESFIISPKLFIYRYVLPGMMTSHLDHVLVNRMINLFNGYEMSEALTRNPFFEAEAGNKEGSGIIEMVNQSQLAVLVKLTHSQVNYEQALANIFTITDENALDLLKMPDMALTHQVWWAFLLARLKHMKLLLKIGQSNYGGHTRMYQNRITIDLSRLIDSHVLENRLTSELLECVISDINEVLKLS